MFTNDDLSIDHKKFVSYVTEVRSFTEIIKYGWISKLINWMLSTISFKYKYQFVFKMSSNIFAIGNHVLVKSHVMIVTNIDEFSNTIWCSSINWTNRKIYDKYINTVTFHKEK